MQRNILIILGGIVIVVFAFFLLRGDSGKEITNYPSGGKTIIAFGDSLVEGQSASPGNDFVSLLSKQIGEPIVNLGKAGDTTEFALRRIDQVLELDPKVVIVLLGGNDFVRNTPHDSIRNNLATIIERIQERGAIVILLGVQRGLIRDTFKKRFEELRDTYGTAYVSNILEDLIGHNEFMADAIHPNDKGYKVIADRIYPVLKELIN